MPPDASDCWPGVGFRSAKARPFAERKATLGCLLLMLLALAVLPTRLTAEPLAGPEFVRLPAVDVPAEEPPAEELPPGDPWLPADRDWWFLPADWYQPWEGSAELGLNGTEGNSETFNIRAGAKAKYTQPWIEHTYEAVHIDNSADGVKKALNGFGDGRIVWPFPESKWSYFVHFRGEYDDFRDYNARLSGDTGPAYDFWKTDLSKLQGRSGVSTSREIGGTDNHFTPELVFGFDLTHKFDDRQKIALTIDYYPAVNDWNDYRINSNASWEIVVSQRFGLSAKLSAIDRYDNTPNGRKPNDLNYAALMLWAF